MKITEQNYLKYLRRGKEEALIFVMQRYGGLVKSVVHRHIHNLSACEDDCINDVFYAVWTHISNYQEEKNPFANWIAGIARLKALDYVREHTSRLEEIYLEEPVLQNLSDDKDNFVELEQEVSKELEQMLSCLKEKDRELFYRLYVEEETMDEIADQMQTDKAVLYNRLSRGKKKLRRKFGKA